MSIVTTQLSCGSFLLQTSSLSLRVASGTDYYFAGLER